MAEELRGTRVAILACSGFEQSELLEPQQALLDAGAHVEIVSPERDRIRGWNKTEWGQSVPVDRTVKEARTSDFDALMIPGGVMNPDHLRRDPAAVALVREMFAEGKPMAVICHGPWMLAEAGIAAGMELTSFSSIKTDLINAGARWVDRSVVIDRGLVTSRNPDDLPAFNRAMIETFTQGREAGQGRRELVGGSTR